MSERHEIEQMIEKWSRALEARDVATMMEDHAGDALLFDACPPYKVEGAAAIREVWERCLPCFPESFRCEHRDLEIHASPDVAVAHFLHHFADTPPDHPCGQTWMRITVGYRKIEGAWKVIHEHVSIPFNPMDGKAWLIENPEELAMPDYPAMSGDPGGPEERGETP